MTGHHCCPSDSTDSLYGSAGNHFGWVVLIMCVYVSDLIQEEIEGPAFVLWRNIVFLGQSGQIQNDT